MSSRDAILGRLRAATPAVPASPEPYRPAEPANLITALMEKVARAFGTAETLARIEELPAAVARYLGEAPPLAVASAFRDLDWTDAGLTLAAPPERASAEVAVSEVRAAIAETGSIVLTSQDAHGPWPNLLADTHIAVVPAAVIAPTLETMVARLAGNRLPRSMHVATGPSRTGDIEQTLELGAHGAVRLHLVIVTGEP